MRQYFRAKMQNPNDNPREKQWKMRSGGRSGVGDDCDRHLALHSGRGRVRSSRTPSWLGQLSQMARPGISSAGGAAAMVDKSRENRRPNLSKMKVHPGMLLKTMKSRFQVSGARCQGAAPTVGCRTQGTTSRLGCGNYGPIARNRTRQYLGNEGSSGDVDENKHMQVSGIRCEVPGSARRGFPG